MNTGFLVYPDMTHRTIEFELEHASQFLGGVDEGHVAVSFQGDGRLYAALFSSQAKEDGSEPNPVASLARNVATTGNPAFLTDPVNAICGPVIFVGDEGQDISLDAIREVKDGIRAVRNYREDNVEDYQLWRAAVLNLGSSNANR
ncbi:hypothetical protein [Corynebacterium alimapuense]|uniref:Uncharacterized protein n=1 Tax=Corynebacterium alimapuense TaxID=1576874 RepID=A0A3M8K7J1_9CORY|nr:hypothetical protein [Corynebacterium alimapuense]RNE48839.1 hypothetical protein C5L39_05940 [Corynebacterium alimapuense]